MKRNVSNVPKEVHESVRSLLLQVLQVAAIFAMAFLIQTIGMAMSQDFQSMLAWLGGFMISMAGYVFCKLVYVHCSRDTVPTVKKAILSDFFQTREILSGAAFLLFLFGAIQVVEQHEYQKYIPYIVVHCIALIGYIFLIYKQKRRVEA